MLLRLQISLNESLCNEGYLSSCGWKILELFQSIVVKSGNRWIIGAIPYKPTSYREKLSHVISRMVKNHAWPMHAWYFLSKYSTRIIVCDTLWCCNYDVGSLSQPPLYRLGWSAAQTVHHASTYCLEWAKLKNSLHSGLAWTWRWI